MVHDNPLSVFSNLQSFSLKRGPILPSFNGILQVVNKSSEMKEKKHDEHPTHHCRDTGEASPARLCAHFCDPCPDADTLIRSARPDDCWYRHAAHHRPVARPGSL